MTATMALLAAGCATTMIPGTQVEDTMENRAVWEVVEAYRTAVENRDQDALRHLVSRRYYENASSTDSSEDDYGYGKVDEAVLPTLRDNVKQVQYRIVLRNVSVTGDRAFAEYEYFAKYLFSEGGRERWKALNDFNRLDLVREDGAWKIIAGL